MKEAALEADRSHFSMHKELINPNTLQMAQASVKLSLKLFLMRSNGMKHQQLTT